MGKLFADSFILKSPGKLLSFYWLPTWCFHCSPQAICHNSMWNTHVFICLFLTYCNCRIIAPERGTMTASVRLPHQILKHLSCHLQYVKLFPRQLHSITHPFASLYPHPERGRESACTWRHLQLQGLTLKECHNSNSTGICACPILYHPASSSHRSHLSVRHYATLACSNFSKKNSIVYTIQFVWSTTSTLTAPREWQWVDCRCVCMGRGR